MTPILRVDKETYHVGETIQATLLYVNPNPYRVSFTPPSEVYLGASLRSTNKNVTIPDTTSDQAVCTIDYVAPYFLVEPGAEFKISDWNFVSTNEGAYEVMLGGLTTQVQIVK